jgi:hypothetical protein
LSALANHTWDETQLNSWFGRLNRLGENTYMKKGINVWILHILVMLAFICGPFHILAASAQQQPQQSPQASDTSQNSSTEPVDKESSEQDGKNGTSNDRLFYALPNFLTLENAGQVPPLTTKEKFKVVLRSSFDYVEYPWYGFLAGISQAENSEPGYGQGAAGYGKRYGAAFADGTIENLLTGAILPSLLKEDPRFFQSSTGSFSHRAWYAASRIFVTRTDSGGERFNFSEIVGSALAAGISTYSYHPRGDRNVPNALSVWGTEVGYDTITIVVKEFWPDIRKKISHKHQPEAPAP